MDRSRIPLALTKSRLMLGPIVLVETVSRVPSGFIAITLVIGLLTDIFDGVLARRWKIVTPELRIADSKADGIYTLCLVSSIGVRCGAEVVKVWPLLAALTIMEFISTVVDYAKYGKPSSHHAYSAKIWALSFCALAVSSLCFGKVEPYLVICIGLGFINNLEGYVIRALLPRWAHDISGIPAAIRMRQVQMRNIPDAPSLRNEVN